MPKYLIGVNLPYHCSLWNSEDFVHQRDLDDEWLDSQIWDYARANQLTIVTRDADFSIRISTNTPPPRIIHFRPGNIKASELFEVLYKNWPNITELSKDDKLVTVYRDRIEVLSKDHQNQSHHMQHSKSLFKLLTFLIIACMGKAASAQSVDDIVAKHIKAMGGEKLGKLQSMKITAEMDIMNMKVPVTTIIVQNKGFRSETTVQGMTVVQAVSGNTGWTINPMAGNAKAVALPEDAVKSLANETDLTGLYNYKEKGYKVTLDGEEDLSGAKVYKVTMTLPNSVRRINYISKDTFYILKIVAQTTVNGQDIMSENTQSDFRAVDGVYYPFTSEVTTSAMPGTKMSLKITALEVNPKIDPKIFEMPQ